jgi:peptidyl-prolyl cis-trans isomerase SurA
LNEAIKMAKMHAFKSCRSLIAAALLVAAATTATFAQNVVVMVNGDPITALDIDQRSKFIQLTTQKAPGRQQVIEELIDEKLKVREGKRWQVEITEADVDGAYANMGGRMRKSADQLTQDLAKSGINANTLKSRIRAELVWQQLVRGRYSASLQVSDKDVDLVLQSKNADEKEIISTDYIMRPILFLVPPGAAQTVMEARRKEAEALRSRFKSCEEGLPSARALRDVTVRDPVSRNSGDLPPELRKVLEAIPVGQTTVPEVTRLGVELFAICSKQESKADSAGKRQARETAFAERFDQQSKLYLQRLRKEALIDRR